MPRDSRIQNLIKTKRYTALRLREKAFNANSLVDAALAGNNNADAERYLRMKREYTDDADKLDAEAAQLEADYPE